MQIKGDMEVTRKYTVNAGGSGWGVWGSDGKKVASFTSRPIGRFEALKYMYQLYGWDWGRSKYVREQPWLRDLKVNVIA